MEKEVFIFAQQMQRQLDNNIIKNDGKSKDLKFLFFELEYHKAKLLLALKEKNEGATKEYIADCANILMFIGNSFNLYNTEDFAPITYEMKTDLFNEVDVNSQTRKTF